MSALLQIRGFTLALLLPQQIKRNQHKIVTWLAKKCDVFHENPSIKYPHFPDRLAMKKQLLILAFLCPLSGFGQLLRPARPSSLQAFVEAGGYAASGGQTPFWLRANQYGIVPLTPTPGFVRGGLVIPYRTTRNRRLDWGGGANVVANAGSLSGGTTGAILVPELYLKARFGLLEIYAGRRRETIGLADTTLSTGSYIWSGNALPMPKIQIALRDYAPVPFTKGVLSVKGTFAHGWFPAQGFVNNSFLHQASFYGRIGKDSWPVRFYGGGNHLAQWGGSTTQLPSSLVENGGQLPSSFKDYLDVVTGSSLGYRSDVDSTKYSFFDRSNRIGNHLGTIDVAMEVQLKKLSFFAYRQSIYEAGALYRLTNITDGLHGLRIRNLQPAQHGIALTDVLLEYLDTRSQGGDVFSGAIRGRENYFNNAQYRDGWSYHGQTIGTPFITPGNSTRYPQGNDAFTNNNRVQVYHLGVSGLIGGVVSFQSKLSYSENYGTYNSPFSPVARQFSGGIWVGAPLSSRYGLNLTASLAVDKGDLYPNNVGGSVSIRKTWLHDRDRVKGPFTVVDSAQTSRPVQVATTAKPAPLGGAQTPADFSAKPMINKSPGPRQFTPKTGVAKTPVVAKQTATKLPPATPTDAKPVVLATTKPSTREAKPVRVGSSNSPMRSSDFPVIESPGNKRR